MSLWVVFFKNLALTLSSYDALQDLIPYTIKEVHDGICGGHFTSLVFTNHILFLYYYWPTLNHDYCDYLKHCMKFQQHANLHHSPSHSLQVHKIFILSLNGV